MSLAKTWPDRVPGKFCITSVLVKVQQSLGKEGDILQGGLDENDKVANALDMATKLKLTLQHARANWRGRFAMY